jgi:hypothetical protein
MKKNILFLLFLVFSSVALSNFKFPNEAQQGTIFLNIERYKDSGLKSFVTTCKTRLECYKKIDNKAFEFSPTYLRIQRQAPTNFSRLIGWSVVAFVTMIGFYFCVAQLHQQISFLYNLPFFNINFFNFS